MAAVIDLSELLRFGVGLRIAAASGDHAAEKSGARAASAMSATAQRKAPKKTGALAESIKSAGTTFTAGVPYAGFVEYGTSRQPPQPFMRPAVTANSERWETDLADTVEEFL
ncbi:MAG: HK97-gp10 family putative phage morphogenesis protein [Planctomycetota bacterium]